MGLLERLRRRQRGPGSVPVHVADPRYDDWEVVRDFGELATARSFLQAVADAGIEAALTSDWPLDRFGQGEISLRVSPGSWSEAEELLSGLDLD